MRFPDLRAVIARKTIKSLKGSTFKTMRNVLREWGLKEGVNYKINLFISLLLLSGINYFVIPSVLYMNLTVPLTSSDLPANDW